MAKGGKFFDVVVIEGLKVAFINRSEKVLYILFTWKFGFLKLSLSRIETLKLYCQERFSGSSLLIVAIERISFCANR